MPSRLDRLREELREVASPERALLAPRYFKAGPGEYAEGDHFLGATVPAQRAIAKRYKELVIESIAELLHSRWHEERLTALFIMVGQFQRGTPAHKSALYELYITNTTFINNWDLVDSSASYIVGAQLRDSPYKLKVLQKLAQSPMVWERRIAVIATFEYIKTGQADEALIICEDLLHDDHDLIHKAVGWMLREVGKRVDQALLVTFLDEHAVTMPRTALRYAIEHFTPERRRYYMNLGKGTIAA